MTNTSTLLARLAASMDSATKREAKNTPKLPTVKAKNTPRLKAANKGKGAKLSISLFAADLARLEAIRAYMAARGHRISTSQTVKLALRTAPLSGDLTAALDAIKAEDGRAK
jgi:hypothetical protein